MFKENDKVYCPIIGSDIYTLGTEWTYATPFNPITNEAITGVQI